MEQVFVVLAVIVYMLFQGAARAGRRPGTGTEPRPRAPEDEQAEAQDRALEALRRWEARQRAAAEPPPVEPAVPRLEPAARRARPPAARREPARRRVLTAEPAERGRGEAYEAIAGMLGRRSPVPPVPEDDAVRSLETLVSAEETPRRRRPPAKGRVVPGARRRPPATRPERVPSVRRRTQREGEGASAAAASPGTAPQAVEPDRRAQRRGGHGLERLEALPPLARAVVLSEVLGRPPSLRDDPSRF